MVGRTLTLGPTRAFALTLALALALALAHPTQVYLTPSLAGLDVHLPSPSPEPRTPPSLPLRAQTTHGATRRGSAAGAAGTSTGSPQSRVALGQAAVLQSSLPLGPTSPSPSTSPSAAVADPHAARRTDALALASRVHLTAVAFLNV